MKCCVFSSREEHAMVKQFMEAVWTIIYAMGFCPLQLFANAYSKDCYGNTKLFTSSHLCAW